MDWKKIDLAKIGIQIIAAGVWLFLLMMITATIVKWCIWAGSGWLW